MFKFPQQIIGERARNALDDVYVYTVTILSEREREASTSETVQANSGAALHNTELDKESEHDLSFRS